MKGLFLLENKNVILLFCELLHGLLGCLSGKALSSHPQQPGLKPQSWRILTVSHKVIQLYNSMDNSMV